MKKRNKVTGWVLHPLRTYFISCKRKDSNKIIAPHSSKCSAYGNQKAMLLCQVLPGEKFPLSDRQQQLTRPPPGYDSVYGVVGSELNYPEIVIYDQPISASR